MLIVSFDFSLPVSQFLLSLVRLKLDVLVLFDCLLLLHSLLLFFDFACETILDLLHLLLPHDHFSLTLNNFGFIYSADELLARAQLLDQVCFLFLLALIVML